MSNSLLLPLDRDLSRLIARRIRAGIGVCWHNARRALKRCPELAAGFYIEGWVVQGSRYLVCEHGWCEINGVIVDPTYYDIEPLTYFPALRFSVDQLAGVRGGEPLIRQWYGWGTPETDASLEAEERYIRAQDAALAYSKANYHPQRT